MPHAAKTHKQISEKASRFSESVIREMTRQAMLYGAVNLAQGFPDFSAPEAIKRAAQEAIAADINQYAITWGAKKLRDGIARHMQQTQGMTVDPETEITVTCGSTEAMIAALMAVTDPGDEVVIFEPFYENYGPDTILSGSAATLRDAASASGVQGRVELRRKRAARGDQSAHARHHREHTQQSHGKGFHSGRIGTDSRSLCRIRCRRHHR